MIRGLRVRTEQPAALAGVHAVARRAQRRKKFRAVDPGGGRETLRFRPASRRGALPPRACQRLRRRFRRRSPDASPAPRNRRTTVPQFPCPQRGQTSSRHRDSRSSPWASAGAGRRRIFRHRPSAARRASSGAAPSWQCAISRRAANRAIQAASLSPGSSDSPRLVAPSSTTAAALVCRPRIVVRLGGIAGDAQRVDERRIPSQ